MSHYLFIGPTEASLARELDRYQNPEPVGDCWEDIDGFKITCYTCNRPVEENCSCRIADCAACGEAVSRATGFKCVTKFHGLTITNYNYHPACFEKAKGRAA